MWAINQIAQDNSHYRLNHNPGRGRMFQQIGEVIRFDGLRNIKKTASLAVIFVVAFWFTSITSIQRDPPAEAVHYMALCLPVLCQFLLPMAVITFGASIIVEDFEKKTGSLLFPKISRSRLLFGRYVVRLAGGSLATGVFYILLAIATAIEYGGVPEALWGSLGWAILYLHLLLSLMTLLSAVLNRLATTIVAGAVLVFYAFTALLYTPIAQNPTLEPVFLLAYFGKIVYACLDMPDLRFIEYISPSGELMSVEWLTPSAAGTVLFVALYTVIFLALAVLIYHRKEVKN